MSNFDKRVTRVSHPVFYNGKGMLLWDASEAVRLVVQFSDDARQVDLTETLGEIVAAGWESEGEEIDVSNDNTEQVAAVSLENSDGTEKFYIINVAAKEVVTVEASRILQAVAVAVRGLLLEGIAQDRIEDSEE